MPSNKKRFQKTIRVQGFDYGSNRIYYVTINTMNQNHYFGEIVDGDKADCAENFVSITKVFHLMPTRIGQKAIDFWKDIPIHYPFVKLDEFVIMPNHMHGIIEINKDEELEIKPNSFGPQSRNLAAVIRAYKASVQRYANKNSIVFEWQSRYFDEIIEDERQLNEVRNYIVNNPMRWYYRFQNAEN